MLSTDFSFGNAGIHPAWVGGITAFLVCVLLVATKKWHGKLTMDTSQGLQKFHTAPTPRIAGVGIFLGILLALFWISENPKYQESTTILSAIVIAGLPAFSFGLLEDVTKKVSVKVRLFATMASGVLGWWITGISLTSVDIWGIDWLLGFTIISVIFTAFAVGGIANAVNIIDGFNGLAAGATLIMFTAFAIISANAGDQALSLVCVSITGAISGFFLVNWPRGKIFLGDGGAYFIGFMLAWVAILLPERNPSISPWTSLLVCAYPILEVVFSFARKSLREGYHPSQPDGVHLHMLTNKRLSRKIFRDFSKTTQNGLTSPFLWFYSSIPCSLAIIAYTSLEFTLIGLAISFISYYLYYNKLAFFRWLPKI